MLPIKTEPPAHATHAGARHTDFVDAVALYVEQRLHGQQFQAQRIHTGVIHHVDRYQRTFIEHTDRIGYVEHGARRKNLDVAATRATLSPRGRIGIARQAKAEPLQEQMIWQWRIWVGRTDSRIA